MRTWSTWAPRCSPTNQYDHWKAARETEIIFVNGTESEIVYYWIDEDGAEHSYGRVAPKSGACQHTFEGHAWVMKNVDGETLSVFYAVLPKTLILEMPTE